MSSKDLYDLFYMDGHGIYVWSAYAITFLLFLVVLFLPKIKKSKLKKHFKLEQYIKKWNNDENSKT